MHRNRPQRRPPRRMKPRKKYPRLEISLESERFVRQGHPWVIRDRKTGDTRHLATGSIVDLVGPDRSFVARALVDPGNEVVARVLTRDPRETIDPPFFERRALRACTLRQACIDGETTNAFRILNGENDGIPGLHIDRLGDYGVAQIYTQAILPHVEQIYTTVMAAFRLRGLYEKRRFRSPRGIDRKRLQGRLVLGEPAPDPLPIREGGCAFLVRPQHAMDTGIFLDQRENRRRIRRLARGREVLNTFAYTCAFSVAAALGGARKTVSVDSSSNHLAWGKENFARNGLDPASHEFVCEDVFAFFGKKRRFDLVILDPPTFSGGKGTFRAERDYGRLVSAALRALRPEGFLLCSTNAAKLKAPAFQQAVFRALEAGGRAFQILATPGPPLDFPTLPDFPQGQPFKSCLLRVF
ncbi:MAG: class I SAM-dependent rRNA methyltransferase [Deltaproteobacteria bacterium]|nr:MAG: class I SAM-dependent rRNA methyltransferase [Deltaproteobacteria bacterium]